MPVMGPVPSAVTVTGPPLEQNVSLLWGAVIWTDTAGLSTLTAIEVSAVLPAQSVAKAARTR